jgi:penicillin-binding protein 1A
MIKKLFYILFVTLLLVCLSAAGGLYWVVVMEPGEEISQENIRRILGKESPVFYNDGTSPLGVFFADAHRQYIEYKDIPKSFIDALIASEDNRFFSHFGFDVVGISRAAIKNIQARRIVQGGSTLTQQTAKNLFKRKNRSFQAKMKELIYALRLEYHYSKEQILEFYVNQFYVSGNGLGLGVAARYYFDKNPEDLTTIESAYIAGSVKRPNYYNPFIKRTSEAARQAVDRGKARVGYVLRNMRGLGMIGEAGYNELSRTEIPFNKGSVGYALDYVMELVTDAVASDQVVDALAAHGIDNIATSGIKVITTVQKTLQQDTLYALRKQLSYLDVRLRGYERTDVQAELGNTDYQGDLKREKHAFLFGTVAAVKTDGETLEIEVDLGTKLGRGFIDRQGLVRLVDARVKWQKNRWSETSKADYGALTTELHEGDRIWVSIRDIDEDGRAALDLEKFPLVKGGAIVMQHGRIAAVAGGIENRFFNRAVYGKRTMGSSFKPFVFGAALQLGWNSADLLQNKRDVFVYQNQPYFPRPDHHIDHELVSMSWAGVRSENLAAVWLTTHLCDHLGRLRLEEVASRVDLAPRVVDGETEPYRLFKARLRDRYGIILNQDLLRKAAYHKTLEHINPDLVFEGLDADYEPLKNLHYGLGFRDFRKQISTELNSGKKLSESEKKELFLRRNMLSRNFLSLSRMRRNLETYLEQVLDPSLWINPDSKNDDLKKPALFYNRLTNSYIFDYRSFVDADSLPLGRNEVRQYLYRLDEGSRQVFVEAIRLGGVISVATHDFAKELVDQEFKNMQKLLPYSMQVLEHVHDYRTLVGLHYLVAFGKALGVESKMEPVLSFPLGSNVVTLLETTRIYEALVTGVASVFEEESGQLNNSLAVIDRIESEDGVVLYRPEPEERTVVSPKTALVIGHVLENTVKYGTGRYADKHVKLTSDDALANDSGELSLSVPLFGKTGTANRYTNASFFGYLPALNNDGHSFIIPGGYSVGVYVGYDDNKAMRKGSTRITGSAGALPAWVDIVNSLIRENGYGASLDPVDLSFYGLSLKRDQIGQLNLGVSADAGGVIFDPPRMIDEASRYQPSIMTFGSIDQDNGFKAGQEYAPFWLLDKPSHNSTVGIIAEDL